MRPWFCTILALSLVGGAGAALAEPVHTTYLWHLEQPIYWPAPNAGGLRYQTAADSIAAKRAGAQHPKDDLDSIFGKDDRVAAYQGRPRDSIQTMLGLPEAGAQVSYAGALIENVASLAAAGLDGYRSNWAQPFIEARGWQTRGGHPRLDLVQFPFHHALLPLVDPEVARMELLLAQRESQESWGGGPSAGLFPSEMAFSEALIPTLVAAGVKWVIVSNAHLSRACANYPYVAGSGGDDISPPNPADVQNPAQDHYNRITIARGVSPANAVPFAYLPHWARYVDPQSGAESRILVVPAAQSESWQDGYACFGQGAIDALSPYNDPARPMLVLLAHDGDNDFGGGYSYYMECTPDFVQKASAGAYLPTTIAEYLADHPPPPGDVVHVESGAWVNADGDFGAPSFLKWNWPPTDANGQVDIAAGFSADERSWAIVTAATNLVATATAVAGEPDVGQILHPERGASDLARAWHYLLGGLDSGYLYYGNTLDLLLKPVVAENAAVAAANKVLAAGATDTVGPTVWLPQRYPYNPGGLNFGPLYGYKQVVGSADFWVWTFAYDYSGIKQATLYVRVDADGRDPIDDDANETYAGGPGVGPWSALPMAVHPVPKGNPPGQGGIDTSILPSAIADEYAAEVTGYRGVLLDYYVEATDARGNVSKSPIAHVFVGH